MSPRSDTSGGKGSKSLGQHIPAVVSKHLPLSGSIDPVSLIDERIKVLGGVPNLRLTDYSNIDCSIEYNYAFESQAWSRRAFICTYSFGSAVYPPAGVDIMRFVSAALYEQSGG